MEHYHYHGTSISMQINSGKYRKENKLLVTFINIHTQNMYDMYVV